MQCIVTEKGETIRSKRGESVMPSKNAYRDIITGATLLLLILQGCMASSGDLPADKAFALSASALSGSDSYGFAGVVSVVDAAGAVGSRAAYEGEVIGHGELSMQWENSNAHSVSVKNFGTTTYQPLEILESISGKSAVISYAETPVPSKPVHFQIKLDDRVARERVAAGLRADLALLRGDSGLLRGDPVKAERILSNAEQRLETAISTLKVTTACDWTADPKDWFPRQLKEETVLTYTWDDKPFREKRVSQTNFLQNKQDGTMKKANEK